MKRRECRSCGGLLDLPRPGNRHFCTSCRGPYGQGHAAVKRRWYDVNKDLAIRRAAAWKERNPEKVAESGRRRYERRREHHLAVCEAWRKRNPNKVRDIRENRRARERAAYVEDIDRDLVWRRFRGKCGVCGLPVKLATMELDHIVPLSRGGLHCYENVQPAHQLCNRRKFTALQDAIQLPILGIVEDVS